LSKHGTPHGCRGSKLLKNESSDLTSEPSGRTLAAMKNKKSIEEAALERLLAGLSDIFRDFPLDPHQPERKDDMK
jgi:hypothetical protein